MNGIPWVTGRGSLGGVSEGYCLGHLSVEFIPVLTPYNDCSQDRWLSNLNTNQDHQGHLVWSPIPQL